MFKFLWISHMDDYKANSIIAYSFIHKRVCECSHTKPSAYRCLYINDEEEEAAVHNDNHEFSKDNVWREEVVVAAARTCRPNMSLKYFHFAQFYGFKKWKIPHAHYQCMCTKCLFCIAKKHTHAQIHAHTSFSAHLVNLSRIWTIFL